MPELPEVETVRRTLIPTIAGKRVTRVETGRLRLRFPIPAALKRLPGARVQGADRRGKVLLLRFGGPARTADRTVLIHLGMSGRLFAQQVRRPPAWEKHEHVRIHLGSTLLRYLDPRRFGSVEITATGSVAEHPRVRNLGLEPFDPAFDGDFLRTALRGRRAPLRDLLLLGRIVAGVGNIYANEACYRAGVRPQRAAGRLTGKQADALARTIGEVLREAIDAGGTTLADGGYTDARGEAGRFQRRLYVYGRDGEPCLVCATLIRRARISPRGLFYCPTCQR